MSTFGSRPTTTWKAFWATVWSGDPGFQAELHRWVGYPVFAIAVRLGIKANYITVLALLVSLASAPLFLAEGYVWKLLAAVFVHLGLAVDTVDGPLARHRNEVSEFGAWLASTCVIFKTIVIWSCVAIGVYLAEDDELALILGMVAVGHLFMSYFLMRTNKAYAFYKYKERAVGTSRRFHLSLEHCLGLLLGAFALADRLDLLLVVFAGAGAVPWVILIFRAVQSARRSGVGPKA